MNQMSSDRAVKLFYKNELDQLLNEKQRQREAQKLRQNQQKKLYNQRLYQAKEIDRIKDSTYKNYYNLLMESQNAHVQSYVSPYSKADTKKQHLIQQAQIQQKKKAEQEERERVRRQQSMYEQYRAGLGQQLQEHQFNEDLRRQEREKQREFSQRMANLPRELESMERDRRREESLKYKQDLDTFVRSKQLSSKHGQRETAYPGSSHSAGMMHNPLYNPIPYNVQNPYILKQMQRSMMRQPSAPINNLSNNGNNNNNQNYFAKLASANLGK